MDQKKEQFWKNRSENYDRLQWATDNSYLNFFLGLCDFKPHEKVLDVGTGTGIIANHINDFVDLIVGVDISYNMISHAYINRRGREHFILNNVHNICFKDSTLDKITARMVFHHVIKDVDTAMYECFRVLKKGGRLIVSEGIPPHICVKDFYVEMFKLKEKRRTFMQEDLVGLFRKAKFKVVGLHEFINRKMSIRNWLINSNLPKEKQNRIFDLHLKLSEEGKRVYNFELLDNDIFIDMKFIVIVGEK